MYRLIEGKLLAWKEQKNRKPLIVRGARQVGKSYSVIKFGKEHFGGNIHVINFEKQPDWHKVFDLNLDIDRILRELEMLINKRIEPEKDLLFFDEIQECPQAIISLRYFYENLPALHVIAAGSLLEFALQDISFPVGRVQLLNMYPMNFYEFLKALGKDLLAEIIAEEPKIISETMHLTLQNELRNYFFVGGMPECVKVFLQSNSLAETFLVQSDLINTFRQDFTKYAPYSDKHCLNTVLASVGQQIGNQIKYSRLAEDFSNPTIKKAFELLETARLIKKVIAASPLGIPLGVNISYKVFKTIYLDIGLLSNLSGLNIANEYRKNELLSIFRGMLAEQFIGQELLAMDYDNLYYWSRQAPNSSAETDFLIEKKNEIIPIEVKSGVSGSLKSLHLLFNTYQNVERAFVFSDAFYRDNKIDKMHFMPLYYVYGVCKKD